MDFGSLGRIGPKTIGPKMAETSSSGPLLARALSKYLPNYSKEGINPI
jgi:hypothetical protein